MADMAYAVVTFKNNDVSELPSNWLDEDVEQASCWWPTNFKNISTLIAKRFEPDKESWDYLPVTVEKFCSTLIILLQDEKISAAFLPFLFVTFFPATLEKARKVAEDANYKTTDDDELGKGRRTIVRKKRYSGSSSEDAENQKLHQTLKRTKPRNARKYSPLYSCGMLYLTNFSKSKHQFTICRSKHTLRLACDLEQLRHRTRICRV